MSGSSDLSQDLEQLEHVDLDVSQTYYNTFYNILYNTKVDFYLL